MSQVEKSSVSDMSTSNAKTATFADALLEQKDDKTDALPSYRERKNIHFTGQSNDYGVTPQMKCVNGFVAFTSPYVALTTRTSALGLNTVWRCVVCHKVKDLKGPHLDGKANVRSDCWPCGKKTTFLRDASAMSESGAVAEPAASNTQAPSNADRAVHAAGGTNASVFAASAATSSSQALASPSGVTSMPAGTAPFKSAFGGVSAPDAARPAAAPFKSACEGVVEWLAPKPPIGSAMKSSLGAARDEALVISSLTASSEKGMSSGIWQSPKAVSSSTVAARGEAAELGQSGCVLPESVWRCVVCHKVKDLKGPHLDGKASVRSDCWPCGKKTTFVQEDSGDRSLMGADGRASRLAEAAGNEGVPVLREPRSTVFKDPVVPSEAEEPRCMLPVTKAGGVQGSAAQDTSVVVLSTNALWRCAVCHKVKDLKGPHLDGKASVRSDCWPCGKKTTFLRDASAMSESGAVAEPAASNTQAPSNADRAVHAAGGTNASVFAASAATSSSQALVSPSGVTSMPAGTAPFKSAFGGVSAPDAARPAAAPFKSAFGDVSAPDAAKPAAAPFKSAFGGVSAPDAAKPAAAPLKIVYDDTRDVSDSEIGKEVKECLKLKEESDGREGDLFATGGEFGVLGSTAGGPGNAGGAGLALSSSCEMGCSKALVPSVASECCSSAVVEKLITRALKEQRVEMKKELECFRKDLLFEVRQAISQEHVHAVAKDQACFEEPPAQMMESLIRRHLSKAFRKS